MCQQNIFMKYLSITVKRYVFVFRTKGQLTLSDLYVSKYILEFCKDIISQRRLKYMLFNNSS